MGQECLIIGDEGSICFLGPAGFSEGISIRVDRGTFKIGSGFSCNKNCFLSCTEGIEIGDNVLLGWDINIRDSDGHSIYANGIKKPSLKPVKIGKHVWIASNVNILKGCIIPDDCVIGYGSMVTGEFEEPGCLIAGYPAKVVQKNISWQQ